MSRWEWCALVGVTSCIPQAVATQSRCRELMAGKDAMEEQVSELRREKTASEKKHGQVGHMTSSWVT